MRCSASPILAVMRLACSSKRRLINAIILDDIASDWRPSLRSVTVFSRARLLGCGAMIFSHPHAMTNVVPSADKHAVTSSTALAIRNSTIIAHRLSIYLPHLLLPSRDPQKLITEINCFVAQFRELLIYVGQSKDCPELREKIRKLRRSCVDACKHMAQVITPQPRHCLGCPSEKLHLTLLFYLTQQFTHELIKSYRLIQLVPIDMTDYYAQTRTGPSNLGNVISQILLCKHINPDFQQEELCSISKDVQELTELLAELQAHMPDISQATANHTAASSMISLNAPSWYTQQRRRSCRSRSRSFCCCFAPSKVL
ncbi:uncharacterized protein LOC115630409 isoform X2 [Scaptodrosophila lebanonensis]|uniref:Uncharacterized protein LOC115630409 isoform X2 n=1 Tax=Drosophila lebanonensis TaxID=7225 RepID=A0A6J2U5L3_DROLE|nr:uncharacterized protein LOC115630409 isoform X2 [Scaptodrosophila lebanonensis]